MSAERHVAYSLRVFGDHLHRGGNVHGADLTALARKLEGDCADGEQPGLRKAEEAVMDALSLMHPDTARRFMDGASYRDFKQVLDASPAVGPVSGGLIPETKAALGIVLAHVEDSYGDDLEGVTAVAGAYRYLSRRLAEEDG